MILAINIEAAFALSSATQPNSALLWKPLSVGPFNNDVNNDFGAFFMSLKNLRSPLAPLLIVVFQSRLVLLILFSFKV